MYESEVSDQDPTPQPVDDIRPLVQSLCDANDVARRESMDMLLGLAKKVDALVATTAQMLRSQHMMDEQIAELYQVLFGRALGRSWTYPVSHHPVMH